ncbi:MAG: cytochrome c [Alphaproteobacteria bacterium]|nr:cytochrome c [Alphaproteobacteria bacterium]
MTLFKKLLVASALVAFGSVAASAQNIVEMRVAKMKEIGGAMGGLSKMAKGEDPYDAGRATQLATLVRGHSTQIVGWFPSGSTGGRAKAEIWTDSAKFKDAAGALTQQADALVRVAATGKDAMAAQFGNVGRSCGGCHTPFRAEAK